MVKLEWSAKDCDTSEHVVFKLDVIKRLPFTNLHNRNDIFGDLFNFQLIQQDQ